MPTFRYFSAQAFVLWSLCSVVFSVPNQPRAKRLEEILERTEGVEKRGICYDDDTLLSFKGFIDDSAPYCSSLLSIQDFTSTVPQTSRTTTSVLRTSFTKTVTSTAIVASVTVLSTSYVPSLVERGNPEPTAPPFYQDNPYAYSVLSDNTNASIASSYYSACSCLHLTPSTVDAFAVTSSTRTITGEDSEETTNTVYVTSGTSTQILTRAGGNPSIATVSTTVSVVPVPVPTTNTSLTIPLSTAFSNTFTLSGTRPTIAPTRNVTSFSVPSLTPSISINSTTRLPPVTGPSSGVSPFPTGNLSSSYFPSSGFPTASLPTSGFPIPSSNWTTSSWPTSGFPTQSANLSISSRPISSFPIPSSNLSASSQPTSGFPTPSANATITSRATSGFPTPSANWSSIVTPTLPKPEPVTVTSIGTAGVPYPLNSSIFVTAPPVTVTVTSISVPGNFSIPTSTSSTADTTTDASAVATTSSAPSTIPTLDISNCPGLNGTIVVLSDGQQFAVVCETEFSGPTEIGLQESTFQNCIEDCGVVNNGFSAPRCRGVTYFPSREGQNCFFKNAATLLASDKNEYAVSAVLINYQALNVTSSPSIVLPTATQARRPIMMPRI